MLTIITPTYNRASKLQFCYSSLVSQTCLNFIWLVIDDGSTDDTEQVVRTWKEEGRIRISYLKKENGGKASALNLGFENLTTPYVCCLDSDDVFYKNSVELALMQLNKIKEDKKCCGIVAIRNNVDGTNMGGAVIPKGINKICINDVLKLGKRGTEVITFYKSDIVSKYTFPVFPGEKFVSPAWLDYELSRNYYFAPSWDKFCVCEYFPDGLTRNKRKIIVRNPKGYTAVKQQAFELDTGIKVIIKNGIMYDCGCIIGKDKDWLKKAPKKPLALLLFPLAWLVYVKRFRKLQLQEKKEDIVQ